MMVTASTAIADVNLLGRGFRGESWSTYCAVMAAAEGDCAAIYLPNLRIRTSPQSHASTSLSIIRNVPPEGPSDSNSMRVTCSPRTADRAIALIDPNLNAARA
jgi:hypothetical protein